MQIIVPDPTYDHADRARDEYLTVLKADLMSFADDVRIQDADIGRGADWPVWLCVLVVFSMGKTIKENLDAWIALSKPVVAVLAKLKERFGTYRIDEHGASLIILSKIASREPEGVVQLTQIACSSISIRPFDGRDPERLDHHPDAVFVQAYHVNRARIYVVTVASAGDLEAVHIYETRTPFLFAGA